jgi:hypothetical protein
MASGGLRATSLSAVTKLDAGQNVSNYRFPSHWLYCVLWPGGVSVENPIVKIEFKVIKIREMKRFRFVMNQFLATNLSV